MCMHCLSREHTTKVLASLSAAHYITFAPQLGLSLVGDWLRAR